MSTNTDFTSATELAAQIRRGDLSPVDAVEECLERLEERNDRTNAFVTVLESEARERAKQAEKELQSGEPVGPLHGVPIGIKDLFDFKAGVPNTMGSKPFEDFVPDFSTTYVERLEDAGAIIVGKTNTPEMGHKGVTDNQLFGPTSTPFDLDRNAGGSSGGSSAAVADGIVPIAQGSDGGGSVRIPASFCHTVGFKASYGRVAQAVRPDAFGSHTPYIHAGPITRTVDDAALMLDVMCGPHPRDPMSAPDDNPEFQEAVTQGVDGLSIAYSPDLDCFAIDERVQSVARDAVHDFEEAGATVDEIEIGWDVTQEELAQLWLREIAVLNHSTAMGFTEMGIDMLKDHREELSPEYRELLEQTMDMSMREHKRDEHRRAEIFDAVQDVFVEYDLLVTPTLSVPPVPNDNNGDGETLGPETVDGTEVERTIGWCLTHPINFTGHPAASVPGGLTGGGLPVGLQLIGDRYDDETVFAAAGTLERVRPWHDTYPLQD